ncbi:MAG: hypothetical protein ACLTA1_12640 [Clostridia bacterium]
MYFMTPPGAVYQGQAEADKNAIKAAIASGTLVSGAALVERKGW